MCKKLPIPIVETIKRRCSVRTYQDKELEPDVRERLRSYMDNLENPFGMQVKNISSIRSWLQKVKNLVHTE